MGNEQNTIKEITIKPGKRVVMIKRPGWYNIVVQEHKDICGGYVNDADVNGWRACAIYTQYTFSAAQKEMENVADRQRVFDGFD